MNLNLIKRTLDALFDGPWFIPGLFWIFAWVLMLLTGNSLIRWLKSLKGMKWSPREDTPDSHLQKAGTPSMGGIGILGVAALSWLAALTLIVSWSTWSHGSTGLRGWDWLALNVFGLCVLAHGILGFVDDWSKARGKGGLTSKAKLVGQCALAVIFLGAVAALIPALSRPVGSTNQFLQLGWPLFLLCAILLIGTSNAVNLTDGIDGLAAGLSVQTAVVFGILLLETFRQPGAGNLFTITTELFWMTLGGACLGFLAFNKNPAKVFMGDTGSLALGAALGAGAILTRAVSLLPFIGFIFYVEMFSVMAQVAYFKYTKRRTGEGKRIFRRAPLHHHFELSGWSEWRVVITFWAINALTTIIGLVLWQMGILPRFP